MSLSLTAEQKNLSDIFDTKQQYVIPSYQRPYSWEYDECYQLYNDLIEAYKTKQDYFIGNLVIAKSNENKAKLEVIDGQQRLTTLILVFKVLSVLKPDLDVLKDFLVKRDSITKKELPKISSEVFEVEDAKDLEKVLTYTKEHFEERIKDFKDKKGNFLVKDFPNRFERNALFFYNWFTYYIEKNTDILDLIRFLLENTYLLPIELSGNTFEEASDKAIKIFETLNNRGKSLDDADIFKGKLYDKAKKNKDEKSFIEQWKELRDRCEFLNIKIDDLFRFYSHIIRGRENKTSAEINIRDFFIKMDYSPFATKNYNEILEELSKVMSVLEFINREKVKKTELAKWLQLIEIYTNQYPKMALVVYLFNYEYEDNKKLIEFLIKLVRFTYYIGSTSTIKFRIFNIIRDISIKKDIDDFIEKDISVEFFYYLGLLKNGYALLGFYLTQDVALSSYNIDKLVNYKDEKFLQNWKKEQIEEVANRLGNFVILDIDKKNLTIDKKVEHYKNSNIKDIKELSNKLVNFTYDKFQERDRNIREILVKFFKGENL